MEPLKMYQRGLQDYICNIIRTVRNMQKRMENKNGL